MKKTLWIIAALAVLLAQGLSSAQSRSGHGGMGQRPERLEKFRTMRLVELLKLNEEDAVRFFAKQSAHEDKIGALIKSRNDALDVAEKAVQDKTDAGELTKQVDQVMDLDQQIFAERQRYQKEMRGFLSPEQFLTFISFERNFGKQVRDALGKMRRSGPGSAGHDHK
jgi:Spy/CpxP family protein refolding chaperone